MHREAGDADAAVHRQRTSVDDNRLFESRQNLSGGELGAVGVRQRQEHGELVTAKAGDRIRFAQC